MGCRKPVEENFRGAYSRQLFSGNAKLLIAAKDHLDWRMSTPPQFGADENPPTRKSPAGEDSPDAALLDVGEIAALRRFFALLDQWDKKKNLT
jgi:hypothetical protein